MPASILTCRAGSISVVAEQLESAIFRYEQPRTRVWTSLSKMIRPGNAWPVASPRVGVDVGWGQRDELAPQGFHDEGWDGRHEHLAGEVTRLDTSIPLPGLVSARLNDTPLPAQPLNVRQRSTQPEKSREATIPSRRRFWTSQLK